jgi:hypothetical protein
VARGSPGRDEEGGLIAMAQVIATLCDECLEAGAESPGESVGITVEIGGARPAPYVIDVCEVHGKPYRDLLAHLAEHGRRSDRKTPLPRPVGAVTANPPEASSALACPTCGHVSRTSGGLTTHMRERHGVSLSEARGEAGIPCPVKGCGRSVAAMQGLMAHLRGADHGLPLDEARALVAGARG